MARRHLALGMLIGVALVAALGASTWGDNYDAPYVATVTLVNAPAADDTIPVRMNYKATPNALALADGAKQVSWTESGRLDLTTAQTCLGAIRIVDDNARPTVFAQTLPGYDAGP